MRDGPDFSIFLVNWKVYNKKFNHILRPGSDNQSCLFKKSMVSRWRRKFLPAILVAENLAATYTAKGCIFFWID
ncbi:hypothetical protein A7Q10_00640 [Methylacidiphilum caldifontis]|uniref:Uncharacterized protein n=1 Tax=Methylacidiphilum caldifontis TaxID=2795386 RepID=A0A4Y8PBM8_9BACT|nr:hypothetical protein A7Q10_00640 [Methylacidiphilum caldifontis]